MRYIILLISMAFFSWNAIADENNKGDLNKIVDEYRIYSLTRCVHDNYKKMGIDFSKSSLKDGTLAFIDIDNGLAFSAEKDNELDNFIKIKTGDFYQPRQKKGDLASVNMVMYDCMAFYHSKELAVFLKQLIRKAEADL